jgi:alkanesulfonate monooxygenase SsuD/methylene tetrahydromethanopterin reductase-like flavin-dependent oxidoreductase (luciferase family)
MVLRVGAVLHFRAAPGGATAAMKFMWFHLMPYTELPEDFREKHPSVWVDIHSSLFDPRRAHHMYNDFMDELEYAAACGFDAICVNEHHSNGYGLMPSPNLIAASLSRRTTDTTICVMGNSLALYNPPTRVAEEFAMIDCISGGRLIAGFPVGTPMDDCFAYGQNPSQLRDRYYEAHDLVMKAWQHPDTFAFNGRYNQQRYVNIWPRPVQRPHPPVWIPGGGSVETWQWCAQKDYVYSYLSYYGTRSARRRWTATGPRWTGWARTAIRIAPASRRPSRWPSPVSRRSSSTHKPRSISSFAACTSIRGLPRRPATPPRRRCGSG